MIFQNTAVFYLKPFVKIKLWFQVIPWNFLKNTNLCYEFQINLSSYPRRSKYQHGRIQEPLEDEGDHIGQGGSWRRTLEGKLTYYNFKCTIKLMFLYELFIPFKKNKRINSFCYSSQFQIVSSERFHDSPHEIYEALKLILDLSCLDKASQVDTLSEQEQISFLVLIR